MNERIRQLAEQAGCAWWEGRAMRDMTRCQDELEKLAELIVRDCAELFEIEWGDEKLTGNDVGYVLKKHFGVES